MKRPLEDGFSTTISPSDGRNIDPDIGRLSGEGSLQRIRETEAPPQGDHAWLEQIPSDSRGPAESRAYYDLPVLKEPVWKWFVPAYFYVGGLAGGCAVLGAAAEMWGNPGMARLSRQCRIVALAGAGASAVLLIADLGRPARFLNMLRVFRPTSPMNLGTWILSAFSGCAGLAAIPVLFPCSGTLRRLGDVAWASAGLIGLPLTGYTGVLLADTAVPLWQGARRALPVLFSLSGAAAAASMLELLPRSSEDNKVVHRFGIVAKSAELAISFALEREVSAVPRVARPLHRGFSGALWKTAQCLTAASLVASIAGRKGSRLRWLSGALGTAGALAIRFALVGAGKQSTHDPRAAFEQQRAELGSAHVGSHPPTR